MTTDSPARTRRSYRTQVANDVAAAHGGVVHRAQLRLAGVSKSDVRTEARAGRWAPVGRHTVVVDGTVPTGEGAWWWAVWESGPGAVLDGVSALRACGLSGFAEVSIDVTLPRGSQIHRLPGVRAHQRRELGGVAGAGIPRVKPEPATIHAAQWAVSDRQAALLVCLPVQQRLVHPARLLAHWNSVRRGPRRPFINQVIRDVCDGAHSLGELDFGTWCRRYGLLAPSRQVVRRLPSGRVYLDAEWQDIGLVVEIDGGHHASALHAGDDALRQNDLTLTKRMVLRIPVVTFRWDPARFMIQVARAIELRSQLREGRRDCVLAKASDPTPLPGRRAVAISR